MPTHFQAGIVHSHRSIQTFTQCVGGVGRRGAQGKAERGSCFHGILPKGGHVGPRCQSPCREITNASMGSLVTHPRGPAALKTQKGLKEDNTPGAPLPPHPRHTVPAHRARLASARRQSRTGWLTRARPCGRAPRTLLPASAGRETAGETP